MHPRDSISWAQRQLAGRHCRKTKEQRKVPPVCACNQNNLCWSSQLSWRKGPGGDTVSASCFSLCRVNGFLRSPETWLNESLRPEHPWTFGKYGFSLECKNFSSDVFLMLFILRKFCSPSCCDQVCRSAAVPVSQHTTLKGGWTLPAQQLGRFSLPSCVTWVTEERLCKGRSVLGKPWLHPGGKLRKEQLFYSSPSQLWVKHPYHILAFKKSNFP